MPSRNFTVDENLLRLRAIVESAIDPIFTINERGIIETVNPAACELFGYDKDELLGQNISIIMPKPHKAQHDAYLQRYLKEKTPKVIGIGREVEGLKKDGTLIPCRLAISEVILEDGQRIFTGILHNLSV